MQYIKKLLPYLFFPMTFLPVAANDGVFDEQGIAREVVRDEQIKTIQFYREGWINSYPVMLMHEKTPLILEFDEISTRRSYFSYQLYHCDADWRRSELSEQEYMDGYFNNQIEEVSSSFNTYISYNHYRLVIPGDDITLSRSGNYIIAIFRDDEPDEVVFTRRFMISEARVNIEARANRPVLSLYRDDSHEIDITIHHQAYRIDDPYGETALAIYQNGIWDYELTGLKPLFVNPGQLVYDYQEENIFPAGNEFRMFNTRSTQVREYHIQEIDYIDYFHFRLKHDEPNPAHLYFDRDDINGKYFIEAANTSDPSVEADYVFVHFTLKMPYPLAGGDIYIAGALANWQFTAMNKMQFDPDRSAYVGTMLVKQGIHNYRYIFLPGDRKVFDISEIEGSHYQTKNEYLILFYHSGQGDRYDRLVGHQVIHSNVN